MNFEHFGVLLDCSRNAVMKVDQVKRMIDYLKKMGYNTLELYTEDTYEIDDEPYFGYMRGRYTALEIREIDDYAKKNGIELIPCIQTLAHLGAIFKHREYKPICDTADILLVDDEKTYTLIDKMFATLAKNFTSRNVNIGMDEAHMVGLGKYLDKHGYQNRFQLLVKHLSRVLEIAKKYGFTPHMWSDMFIRLVNNGEYYIEDENFVMPNDVIEMIPNGVDLVFWDYYHKTQKGYDNTMAVHETFGKPYWFAGGAWSWCGFAPLNWFALVTMKPAMQSVRAHKVKNVLITMWGDHGGECSYFSLLPSLYAIRQYAEGIFDEERIARGFYELFGVEYNKFCLLDLPNDPNNVFLENGQYPLQQNPCMILLYSDPFMGVKDDLYAKGNRIDYANYAQQLLKESGNSKEFKYIFNAMGKLCEALAIKADLGIRTRNVYDNKNRDGLKNLIQDYNCAIKKVKEFHSAFSNLWHLENKPFGWEIQDARLGGLIMRLSTCRDRLEALFTGRIDKIEELEEKLLPMEEKFYLYINSYSRMFSWNNS